MLEWLWNFNIENECLFYIWRCEAQIMTKIMANNQIGSLDAPPNSLKNSNACPKVKTMKEKGVGVHSLDCNTSGVRGAC